MYPVKIERYTAPATISEALMSMAQGDDDTVCLAGGMSVMQAIKSRIVRPKSIIDLGNLLGLRGIAATAGGVRIGALTRYVDMARSAELANAFAALSDAAAHVGDRQVRNRGTIGGSLCWNYVLACIPAASLCLGVELELQALGEGGNEVVRHVPINDFLVGPLQTSRRPNELLVAIHVRAAGMAGGSAYKKWGPVTDALPSVGVAVSLNVDENQVCQSARFVLAGLPTGPRRMPKAEALLCGVRAGDGGAITGALEAAAAAADYGSDSWASWDYRRMQVKELGADVVARAFARAAA